MAVTNDGVVQGDSFKGLQTSHRLFAGGVDSDVVVGGDTLPDLRPQSRVDEEAGGVGPVANRSSGMEQSGVKDEQAPNQVSQEVTQVKNDTKKPGATDLYGDPLPAGALARMGTVQLRHGGAATAFSPDGNVLATVDDKSLRLWSMASGKLLREVKDNYGWGPVMFSPDGKWLATAISESLWLLDAVTGKPVRRIPTAGRVLDFSPDGKLVATSGNDPKEPGSVFLWHTATG